MQKRATPAVLFFNLLFLAIVSAGALHKQVDARTEQALGSANAEAPHYLGLMPGLGSG